MSVYYNLEDSIEFKVSVIYATTKEYEAARVSALIEELPQESELQPLHYTALAAARNAYDGLTQEAQALVQNEEKLSALEESYDAKYEVIADMSEIGWFGVHSTWNANNELSFSSGNDPEYGDYLAVNYTKCTCSGSAHEQMAIQYTIPDLATKLEGVENVYFYFYNGGSADGRMLTDFGGTMKTNYCMLPAGEWTLVTVSAEDFAAGSYFGVMSVYYNLEDSIEFKVSMIYASKTENA